MVETQSESANGNGLNFLNKGVVNREVIVSHKVNNFINDGLMSNYYGFAISVYDGGYVENFVNTGTIQAPEAGIRVMGISNTPEIKNFKNTGNIIFSSKSGAQILMDRKGKINITEWKITIDKSAADYNDINNVDLTNGNANDLDRIIIYGEISSSIPTNVTFGNQAIKLEAGANFEIGKEYNLENVVLLNDGTNGLSAACDKINNGVALSGKNFSDGNPNDMVDFKFLDNDTTINQNNTTKANSSVIADINHKKAISATLNQSLSNESVRRANFVQSVVANAINSVSNANLNLINLSNLDLNKFDFSNDLYANLRSDIILDNVLKNASKAPKFHTFILPYYNYTDTKNAKTNSYGIIAGANKDYGNLGIFGLYLGVEKANTEANFTQEFNDNSFYFGLNHFKEIYSTETSNAYFKTLINSGFTRSKISRNNINNDKANLYSIGASLNAGMNFYLNEKNTLNPEFGLELSRYRAGAFKIENEEYLENYFTLIQPKIALNYSFLASENLALNLQGGFKLNLDKNIENSVIINNTKINSKTSLNSFYGFGEIGVSYDINTKTSLSLNYNLLKSSDLDSHTGYLRVDFRF